MSCCLSLWLGIPVKLAILEMLGKWKPKDSNNHRGSAFKDKLGRPSNKCLGCHPAGPVAAQAEEGQTYPRKRELNRRWKLQPLGHTTEPRLLTWYQVLGWRGESQSDPDLMLLRVSDSFPLFVPWHEWNSHPIFTLKLCRCGMNTIIKGVMGKTASIWPLTQVSLIPKNNRWKKLRASGLALRVK